MIPIPRCLLVATAGVAAMIPLWSQLPADYSGKPFSDGFHKTGPQSIPGLVQCALYDLGGEGVAYHDTDATNNGSGKLNREAGHQRAHAGDYVWHFREAEGVDLSFVKDWAWPTGTGFPYAALTAEVGRFDSRSLPPSFGSPSLRGLLWCR